DHTYVEMQLKLGLISRDEAMASDLRSVLTRTLGQNLTVQVDITKAPLNSRDCIVVCSDGLHGSLMDREIAAAVTRMGPKEACEYFIDTAENRRSEDNISVQVIRVDEVRQTAVYRKMSSLYANPKPENTVAVSTDIDVGQVLDDRFEISE